MASSGARRTDRHQLQRRTVAAVSATQQCQTRLAPGLDTAGPAAVFGPISLVRPRPWSGELHQAHRRRQLGAGRGESVDLRRPGREAIQLRQGVILGGKSCARSLEGTTFDDIIAHAIAGALAGGPASIALQRVEASDAKSGAISTAARRDGALLPLRSQCRTF